MNNHIRNALQYIVNTGESVNAEQFDEDHEPIGPMLRKDIDKYIRIEDGILKLTDIAKDVLLKNL